MIKPQPQTTEMRKEHWMLLYLPKFIFEKTGLRLGKDFEISERPGASPEKRIAITVIGSDLKKKKNFETMLPVFNGQRSKLSSSLKTFKIMPNLDQIDVSTTFKSDLISLINEPATINTLNKIKTVFDLSFEFQIKDDQMILIFPDKIETDKVLEILPKLDCSYCMLREDEIILCPLTSFDGREIVVSKRYKTTDKSRFENLLGKLTMVLWRLRIMGFYTKNEPKSYVHLRNNQKSAKINLTEFDGIDNPEQAELVITDLIGHMLTAYDISVERSEHDKVAFYVTHKIKVASVPKVIKKSKGGKKTLSQTLVDRGCPSVSLFNDGKSEAYFLIRNENGKPKKLEVYGKTETSRELLFKKAYGIAESLGYGFADSGRSSFSRTINKWPEEDLNTPKAATGRDNSSSEIVKGLADLFFKVLPDNIDLQNLNLAKMKKLRASEFRSDEKQAPILKPKDLKKLLETGLGKLTLMGKKGSQFVYLSDVKKNLITDVLAVTNPKKG